MTDMKMPGMDGLSLLREIRRRSACQPVLVITGYGTVENAVETMREGATDYLLKPFSFEALKKARIELDRKILSDLATNDPKAFNAVLAAAGYNFSLLLRWLRLLLSKILAALAACPQPVRA